MTLLISAVMYDRLRREIRVIAQIMERKFRDHPYRGDPFQYTTWEFLESRYKEETEEFWNAIKKDKGEDAVYGEAADRMNFILMQAEKYSRDWRKRNGMKLGGGESRQEAKGDYIEENSLTNPNGHPDKLRQESKSGE